MHPWKNIIKGKTEKLETKACFICLERIPCSDDDIELKLHLLKIHSANVHLKELVEMCTEAEEREEREGWSIDDIFEEERNRKKSEEKKRAESGGLDNNKDAESKQLDCFLCQKIVKSCNYNKHLEKQHGLIFGLNKIKKAGEKNQGVPPNNHETGEAEPKIISMTDADTVKNMVETKYLTEKLRRKNRESKNSC